MEAPGTRASRAAGICCLAAALLALSLLAGRGGSEPGVEITAFDPASGTRYPGEAAASSLRLENTGSGEHTFWVGYSVRDGAGSWHDVPARPVTLQAGEESRQEMSWRIPEGEPLVSGSYEAVMAVWDGEPGEEATRLADARREKAFAAFNFREEFGSLTGWSASGKSLGRGSLDPQNVSVSSGRLRLKLPARTLDGGEVASEEMRGYGTYRAQMKVADAPSSITGFFLYREPDYESELDVETLNEPSGRVLFITYSGGEQTNTAERELPFDPTAGFHEYRFDLYPGRAEFYADGELLQTFDEGLPERPMRLYVNAWYPEWLPGELPETSRYTYVDWIRH